MNQIQWILSIIPDAVLSWFYWAIIVVGVSGMFAGWVGRFIPMYGKYIGFIKPVGIVLVILGVWLRGGYDTEMAWRAKVEQAEAKVAQAEIASKDANTKLAAKIKEKTKVRTEYITTVKERIVEKEKLIDAECKLDPSVPQILNDGAKNIGKKQ
jgi:hypothetical protein